MLFVSLVFLYFFSFFFAVLAPDGRFLFEASKRNEKMLFRRLAQKRRKTLCVFLVLLNADGKAVGLVGMEGCGAPHARGLVVIRCALCMRDDFMAACGRLQREFGTWCVGGRTQFAPTRGEKTWLGRCGQRPLRAHGCKFPPQEGAARQEDAAQAKLTPPSSAVPCGAM